MCFLKFYIKYKNKVLIRYLYHGNTIRVYYIFNLYIPLYNEFLNERYRLHERKIDALFNSYMIQKILKIGYFKNGINNRFI